MDIDHGHEAWACSIGMHNGLAKCNGHAWWSSSNDKQNRCCTVDMQHVLYIYSEISDFIFHTIR
jgi:hypothetical protein